jgi:hypothetical protein
VFDAIVISRKERVLQKKLPRYVCDGRESSAENSAGWNIKKNKNLSSNPGSLIRNEAELNGSFRRKRRRRRRRGLEIVREFVFVFACLAK